MKTPDDNNLDRLFREGLNRPDGNAEFREEDWEAMEELLDEKPHKKRGIFWLYCLSGGIAAMLVLFFGWEMLKPANQISSKDNKPQIAVRKNIPDAANKINPEVKAGKIASKYTDQTPGISADQLKADQRSSAENKIQIPENDVENSVEKGLLSAQNKMRKNSRKSKLKNSLSEDQKQNNARNLVVNEASRSKNIDPVSTGNTADAAQDFYTGKRSMAQNKAELAALQSPDNFTDPLSFHPEPVAVDLLANRKSTAEKKLPPKTSSRIPPQFTLAILSAPDVNGVSNFTGSKVGTNAGLQLSVQLTRKWSITTGAVYAAKPYEINAEQYRESANYRGKQGEVAVDCKVLDIPVNLNYQVYSKNRNSFSAGAGLSSYYMLHENYAFYYTDNTSYDYSVTNKNKHFFGVVNLNATYQRQVNANFSLMVQPYLKLPLTPIGNEHVSLQSAGLAIGVGWNIRTQKNK